MRPGIRQSIRMLGASVPAALVLSAIATPAQALEPGSGHAGLALAAHTISRPQTATGESTATVRPGDTVTSIARRHGVRVVDVLTWNGLSWSSIIHPGQMLRLTAADAAPVAASPPPPAAAPPPAAPASAAATGSYTVAAGDTMSGIARRHGVSTDALLTANGLNRSSIIYPGQTVTIPGAAASSASVPAVASATALDAEQTANAQIITRVGRELGVSDRGIAIALATAMQESWLRNLDYGPDDSLGVFQQRPSTGWGTDAEVRDPDRAARAFFGGPADPNGGRTRGLLDIAGWQDMGFAEAAQAVQVSAYPDRYGAWEQSAYVWLAALG